jgi:hypothetical protein
MTADEYLALVKDWDDPNPAPVLADHEGFVVVRDDLLNAGTKVRGLDYLIGHDPQTRHVKEWVFGSCPATGYAQISLPVVCRQYGTEAHLFMAARNKANLHAYQKRGIEEGAIYHWVPNGMLTVTQARARAYAEHEERMVLPLGLEHPSVTAAFIKVARDLDYSPHEVWSVGSSGSLNRSLQLAWPDAEVHVVSVGHAMSAREIGRAIFHRSPYKFDRPIKPEDAPPYPSAPTYDAKLWPFVKDHARPGALIWNVGA